MAKIGYARVSTHTQKEDSQVDELTAYGCEEIFRDKSSGKNSSRPVLDKTLAYLRAGDVLVITRLSRYALAEAPAAARRRAARARRRPSGAQGLVVDTTGAVRRDGPVAGHNFTQPLIRYELTDRFTPQPEDPAGRLMRTVRRGTWSVVTRRRAQARTGVRDVRRLADVSVEPFAFLGTYEIFQAILGQTAARCVTRAC